ILSKILGYAEEIGDLRKPPPKIRRLKVPPPTFDFLDLEEGERLIKAAKLAPDPWCVMMPVAMLTGLRLGELRGLQWDDVDLVAARLTVQRAADDCGALHPPKSGRSRVVDLPRRAVAFFRGHKHLRGPFVFCMEDGSMLTRWSCEPRSRGTDVIDGPLARICRKAGLRRIGWHVLRHTYASHLVMHGAKLIEVKDLLGHASLEMTMRYAHLSPEARKAAVELLDAAQPRHYGGINEEDDS
ncbi:MAG: site-specific integrase, partial [Myxococcales bacterium]|nr:site-specific integrase [Myxococcales bacterium]